MLAVTLRLCEDAIDPELAEGFAQAHATDTNLRSKAKLRNWCIGLKYKISVGSAIALTNFANEKNPNGTISLRLSLQLALAFDRAGQRKWHVFLRVE